MIQSNNRFLIVKILASIMLVFAGRYYAITLLGYYADITQISDANVLICEIDKYYEVNRVMPAKIDGKYNTKSYFYTKINDSSFKIEASNGFDMIAIYESKTNYWSYDGGLFSNIPFTTNALSPKCNK
jgi:hypothetical protein